MRLTVGFSEVAPHYEVEGPAGERLSERHLPGAKAISATRALISRDDFLGAFDEDWPTNAALVKFIEQVRSEEDDLLVQLKWLPA